MPPLSRIRSSVLEALARELRHAPAETVARQVRMAVELAADIEPGEMYPVQWLVVRLTGFEVRGVEDVQIVGEALLGDLSAFVERLSEEKLDAGVIGLPLMSLSELRSRWGVSERTIERYRRRGLVALRLAESGKGSRLVFPVGCVEGFERRRGGVGGVKSTRRVVAEVRAARPGRGVRGTPGARRARAAPGPRDEEIWSMWLRGVSAAELVARSGLTRASVHRVVNARRASLLRGLALPEPGDERADREACAHPLTRGGLGEREPSDVRGVLEASRSAVAALAAERARAWAYGALRRLARGALERAGAEPGSLALDEVETLLRWATLVKVELVRMQRPLIVRSIEERLGKRLDALDEAMLRAVARAAYGAAIEGVERFDASGPGRVAAPVSLALSRALAGVKGARGKALAEGCWTRTVNVWQAWLDAPEGVREAVEGWGPGSRGAAVLAARFGWDGGPPRTLREIEAELGASAATVSRLLRRAQRDGV